MKRCVNNNFSFEGFWRQWHATLNKWILRYMCACLLSSCRLVSASSPLLLMMCLLLFRYIPLGGRRTQLWSMWIIFTFIGLWHDLWCVRRAFARFRPQRVIAGGAGSPGLGSTAAASPWKSP